MKSFHVAYSLIRIPRLFFSLIFWPFFLGLVVVLGQLLLTAIYFQRVNESPAETKERVSRKEEQHWIRDYLYGNLKPFPTLSICRWVENGAGEVPPNDACRQEDLDVAIQVESPATFDVNAYSAIFEGQTRKIHLCKDCTSDITLRRKNGEQTYDIYRLRALGVYVLAHSMNEALTDQVIKITEHRANLEAVEGQVQVYLPGLKEPLNLHSAKQTAPFVLNVISLLLIAIWLSLRAHRTVLDYFSRNDVLLPLVSACGKQVFYKALWLITAVRVFFFLFAIFPFLYLSASWIQEKRIIEQLFRSPVEMDLWIIALLASLGATTIISSLAELKHHHSFTAVLYKYVPFGCCLLGVLVWGWSIVIGGSSILSDLVLSLPVFGLIPIAVSPVLKLDLPVVFLHATLSIALMVMLLRINAKWFASHLEEV